MDSLRLRVLALRDPSLSPADAGDLSDLGLLVGGCPAPVDAGTARLQRAGADWILNLTGRLRADGYYFAVGNGSVATDPVRWVVESSADGAWVAVGASAWRLGRGGSTELFPGAAFNTPIGAHETSRELFVDMRPTWPAVLLVLVGGFEWAATLLACAAAAVAGRERLVRQLVLAAWTADVVLTLAAAVGNQVAGDGRAAGAAWMLLLAALLPLSTVAMLERRIVAAVLAQALLYAAASATAYLGLYCGSSGDFLTDLFTGPAPPAAALVSGALLFRHRAVAIARRLVAADRQAYDARWAALLATPGARAALETLQEAVRHTMPGASGGGGCWGKTPRQLNRCGMDRESTALLGLPGSLDAASPVRSLDQLYMQVAHTRANKLSNTMRKHERF